MKGRFTNLDHRGGIVYALPGRREDLPDVTFIIPNTGQKMIRASGIHRNEMPEVFKYIQGLYESLVA